MLMRSANLLRIVGAHTRLLGGATSASTAAASSKMGAADGGGGPPLDVLPFRIPEPIERSPTDLLEALASTVGVDVTASHFAFIDDPAMLPSSSGQKVQYYMCKEFGKRAARQLAMEWPTLFMFDRDQPRLSVFRPEKPLDPLVVEANETNLRKLIDETQVADAIGLYERMRADNVGVSSATSLDLFNLACYYNAQNVPVGEWKEWHGIRNFHESDEPQSSSSSSKEIIDLLFESVEKTSKTYSARICNLLKFGDDVSEIRAKTLFEEMIRQRCIPTEEVFNAFIALGIPTAKSVDRPKFDVTSELREMARHGVRPSVRTFNSAIASTYALADLKERFGLIRGLLAEMNACEIEPNLTTLYYFIMASFTDQDIAFRKNFSEQEMRLATFAVDTSLRQIEARNNGVIRPSQFTDDHFFTLAMEVANHVRGDQLAERIRAVYENPANAVHFRSFVPETRFFTIYLMKKLASTPLDEFERIYTAYVPRVASLNAPLSFKIIKRLEREPILSLLRRIIEDGIVNGMSVKQELADKWQNLLINFPTEKLSELERDEYVELVEKVLKTWHSVNLLNEDRALKRTKEEMDAGDENNAANAGDAFAMGSAAEETKRRQSRSVDNVEFEQFEAEMIRRGVIKPLG